MASLLPVVHGGTPILAMSGGGMSLLPDAPSIHIAGMHGGASLLPVGPDVPVIAMKGGKYLYSVPYGTIADKSVGPSIITTFGIVDTFSHKERAIPVNSSCLSITETSSPLCDPLQPFVNRRVQALLKRVHFPSGDASFDMGCGTIARKGTVLTIVFHHKGITLLSSDLTGTFTTFHKGVTPYMPSSMPIVAGTNGLLSWMLGSPVTDVDVFDLITFMEQIHGNHTLSLEGFRRFLSYHKESIEEMDVLRYAMELYGYRTGKINESDQHTMYGLILVPDIAVRRTGTMFDIYVNGVVTQGAWDSTWSIREGFAVYTS